MNRFRKSRKEKVKEESEPIEPMPTSLTSKLTKKVKRPEPEEKPELDLASVLPSTDDFRTSLLMPKLSARFSMLREQDDPDSLIGKASDDSVLFPKRASKLNIFGHHPNPLSDIDEASIDGRPSFHGGRTDSFISAGDGGDGTDEDRSHNESIMSRARRAEGNNLFGGRQKVYKIPSKQGNGSAPMGRALYEHDLNLSTFQRLRLKEKEERAAEEAQQDSLVQESEDLISSISSMKRTNSSSTASGPTAYGRTSTAATSIDEDPSFASSPSQAGTPHANEASKPAHTGVMASERGSVKSRRLYGQGLAQTTQNQQSNTLHRLESLSRQRAGTPELPVLNRSYSRSATNLRDRLQKLSLAEPTASAPRPTSPPSSATSPNPPSLENEPEEPKAQPMPGFGAPPLSPPVSENEEVGALAAALQPDDRGKATAMGLFNKPKSAFDENQFTRRQLQMHQGRSTPPLRRAPSPPGRVTPPEQPGRSRGLSNTSHRSRPDSASSHYSESQRPGNSALAPSVEASPAGPTHGTSFANPSPDISDGEGDHFDARDVAAAIDAVHPAFRSSPSSRPSSPPEEQQNPLPEVRFSDLRDLKPIAENDVAERPSKADVEEKLPEKPDSPTLGPSGLGLSGLVRAHLRRDSDRSSFHLAPLSPAFPPKPNEGEIGAKSIADGSEMSDGPSQRSSTDGEHSIDSQGTSKTPSWEEELRSKHRRQGSIETQQERAEFELELAERRRKVQEKLRGFAENESRSASPISGRHTPDYPPQAKPGNAFALLKSKNPKHPFFSRQEPKNAKLFGPASASTPSLVPDELWREEEEKMPFNLPKHANTSSPQIAVDRSIRSRMAAFGRSSHEDSRESSRSRGASPHSSMRSRRDRSGSDASGRSKSRSRFRDRDDLGTLQEDAAGSPKAFPPFDPRSVPSVPSSTRPSVEANDRSISFDRSSSAASGRYRSESRSATSSVNDRPPHLPPPSTTPSIIGVSPRPSPIAPYSANATPPLYEMSPNPSTTSHVAAGNTLPQRAPGLVSLQKRVIDKTQISEPTFVSCTSNVPTVGLPPGASLSNGMETPPIPPMNPRRRRQTTTQTILGALKGEKRESYYPTSVASDPQDEQSNFSDDNDKRPKSRHNKLRKTSSEGGSLNSRARQQAMAATPIPPAPAVPQYPPKIPMEGGMF
ncbi:uncharacterized protein ACLA_069220 [Aspergillus clavatus NRRL 1]|uniref:Uncharacterized protein n=1 Tax=Aspergillus clavatus (strain ATCC 1007 / CBS 513.65 / DSM 816 / NCTC 3887 / NRRL 1 / QM 1276 / 107) TaxID=344612 RepID=A1C672_ASPCL|nr:uncharacterized protein ACLA_069220 [Aspergillus clavatus NRRL 1]EAW13893.1 conserved hypothetical protein [Aspergillus clavatus NRRL 1]